MTKNAQVPQKTTISAPRRRQRVGAEHGDRVGHAAERAERRGPHDQPDHAEDDLRGDLEDAHDRLALALGEHRDRRGDEDRQHEDAQDLVLDERRDEARRQQVVGDEADEAGRGVAGLGDRLLGRLARRLRSARRRSPSPGAKTLAAIRPSASATTVIEKK